MEDFKVADILGSMAFNRGERPMLAEIFVLQLEAERRAMEIAVDMPAPRFVPFKSEPWQSLLRREGRARLGPRPDPSR